MGGQMLHFVLTHKETAMKVLLSLGLIASYALPAEAAVVTAVATNLFWLWAL
jgi:hypothetical protein